MYLNGPIGQWLYYQQLQQVIKLFKKVKYVKLIFLVIASQAIITGCFSLLSQAGSLGFCVPLRVEHKSKKVVGQIYVPVSLI